MCHLTHVTCKAGHLVDNVNTHVSGSLDPEKFCVWTPRGTSFGSLNRNLEPYWNMSRICSMNMKIGLKLLKIGPFVHFNLLQLDNASSHWIEPNEHLYQSLFKHIWFKHWHLLYCKQFYFQRLLFFHSPYIQTCMESHKFCPKLWPILLPNYFYLRILHCLFYIYY